MHGDDPAAAITQAALTRNDPLANQALDLFVDIYGAQAGNLVSPSARPAEFISPGSRRKSFQG